MRVHRISLWRAWPLVPALAVLAVYLATLAPGLTWSHNGADGGDLLTAALTWGVPHPSGYPTYVLLLRLFTAIMSPWASPAWAGNLLSALLASLAVVFIALICERTLAEAGAPNPWTQLLSALTAIAAGLAPTLWSQAVITEVYALHAAFVASLLWLVMREPEHGAVAPKRAAVLGLVIGVGLGNHLSLLFTLPALAAWWWSRRVRLSRSAWATGAGAAFVGASVYLYLPVAASNNPPVNWGDPDTLSGLLWEVTGRAYRPLMFSFPLPWLPWRISGWANLLLRNLTFPGVALALLGLWASAEERPALLRLVLIQTVLTSVYALGYDTADSFVYLIPIYLVSAPAIALGAWVVLTEAREWPRWPGSVPRGAVAAVLIVLFALIPVSQAWIHWAEMDLSEDREAEAFAREALAEVEPDAIVVAATDNPTFSLWYHRYGLRMRPDVAIVNINLFGFDWYRRTLRATHPDIMPSDDLDFPAFLRANLPQRPVYAAEMILLDPSAGYSLTVTGRLFRVKPVSSP